MITLTHYGNFLENLLTDKHETLSTLFNVSIKLGKANIIENADSTKIEMLLPGFTKEQVSIDIEANVLTVSAKPAQLESSAEKPRYLLNEFELSDCVRQFKLSKYADTTNIDASFENGILTISVPNKTENEVNKLKIEVK